MLSKPGSPGAQDLTETMRELAEKAEVGTKTAEMEEAEVGTKTAEIEMSLEMKMC